MFQLNSDAWTRDLYTVDALEAKQGPALQSHSELLWAINWVLTASPDTIVSSMLAILQGKKRWVLLQHIATQANNNLPGFLQTYTGRTWNLVTLD